MSSVTRAGLDRLERALETQALRRRANERVVEAAVEVGLSLQLPLEFVCECSHSSCETVLERVTVAEYLATHSDVGWFIVARGHEDQLIGCCSSEHATCWSRIGPGSTALYVASTAARPP
jgi:hypothetical protein